MQGDAVNLAETTGQPVQHPLADAIRRASNTPEQAVSFFASILHPDPAKRSTASQAAAHPYLRTAMRKIPRDWVTSAAPNASINDESAQDQVTAVAPSASVDYQGVEVSIDAGTAQEKCEAATPNTSFVARQPISIPVAAAVSGPVSYEATQVKCDSSAQCVEESDDSGTYDSVVSARSDDEEWYADRVSSSRPSVIGNKKPLQAAAAGALKHLGSGLKSLFGRPCRQAAASESAATLSPQPQENASLNATPRSFLTQRADPGLKSIKAVSQSRSHALQPAATVAQPISQVALAPSARSPRLNMALFPSLPAIKSSAAQPPQAFDPFILTPSTEQNPTSSSSIQHIAQQFQAATPATSSKAEVQAKAQVTCTVVQLTADCTAKPATKQMVQEGTVSAVPAVRRKKQASAVKQFRSKAADLVGTSCFGKGAAAEGAPVKEASCSDAKKAQR